MQSLVQILVLIALALFANKAAGQTVWTQSTIESAGIVGSEASLALEPGTDAPTIVYTESVGNESRMRLATRQPGNCGPSDTWNCSYATILGGILSGNDFSALFTTSGQLAVAAHNPTSARNHLLGQLNNANSSLYGPIETDFNQNAPNGLSNVLKFDAAGQAHVVYWGGPLNKLTHAVYVGTGGNCGAGSEENEWRCERITQLGSFAGLTPARPVAMDLRVGGSFSGTPRIAYHGANGLSVAYRVASGGNCGFDGEAGKWQCDVIEADERANNISMRTSGSTDTFIAYVGNASLQGARLKYARTVASGGNCGTGAQAGKWQCDGIDPVGEIEGVSLAMRNGKALIAYQKEVASGKRRLMTAQVAQGVGNCGPVDLFATWQCDAVDTGQRPSGVHNVGRFASLAIKSDGLAMIAYYDETDHDLLVAEEVLPTATPTVTPTGMSTPTPTITRTPTATATPGAPQVDAPGASPTAWLVLLAALALLRSRPLSRQR